MPGARAEAKDGEGKGSDGDGGGGGGGGGGNGGAKGCDDGYGRDDEDILMETLAHLEDLLMDSVSPPSVVRGCPTAIPLRCVTRWRPF